MKGGLELALDSTVKIAERVNTWGFPLIYNGPAPIISVGYVSGYYKARPPVDACDVPRTDRSFQVMHLVVNGAFNPGNSGAPLFLFGQNKAVGLVIWKNIAFSDNVKNAVNGFINARTSLSGNFLLTMPDGTTQSITDQQMIGIVRRQELFDSFKAKATNTAKLPPIPKKPPLRSRPVGTKVYNGYEATHDEGAVRISRRGKEKTNAGRLVRNKKPR